MSAVEVNRIFEAIESQYEIDGTIDPEQKAMLFMEMKKFKGGDKFVHQICAAFEQIENEDEKTAFSLEPKLKEASVTSRCNKLKFNLALKVFRLFQFSCNVDVSATDDNDDD